LITCDFLSVKVTIRNKEGWNTLEIKKQYIIDDRNRKIAVQIDIDTFTKIEDILENYVLVQMIKDSEEDESYGIQDAKAYYKQILEKR
jgi:rubrerythrin